MVGLMGILGIKERVSMGTKMAIQEKKMKKGKEKNMGRTK
jgi:hypothetical protein